jgi:CubicO group peptidase (beta-lactamase class C family)
MMNVLRFLRLGSFVAAFTVAMLASAQQRTQGAVALQIDDIMKSHAAAGDFSGSTLVARDGRILYQHAFGYANLEWKIPNDL